jgi:hypothetical protein
VRWLGRPGVGNWTRSYFGLCSLQCMFYVGMMKCEMVVSPWCRKLDTEFFWIVFFILHFLWNSFGLCSMYSTFSVLG